MTISIEDQINEVERELKMRVGVYKGLIARGRMTSNDADYKMDCMRAVLKTLWHAKNYGEAHER